MSVIGYDILMVGRSDSTVFTLREVGDTVVGVLQKCGTMVISEIDEH